jgi:hypothetical protein
MGTIIPGPPPVAARCRACVGRARVRGAGLLHERGDPLQPFDGQERNGTGAPLWLRPNACVGPAQSDGGVPAIGQTDDEIRVRAPTNADDVNLLATEGMMGMGHRHRFERRLG